MRVIIVDDEPKAIDLLSGYLNHFKGVELVGTFRNGLKAFEFLSKEKVDVVFLDINMPHITGISLSKMIDSATKIILFIDEAHTLVGAGGAAGTGDAANLLKPALARGTLRTIAATTWAEYKEYIEKDPALTRRFQVVQVLEPSEPKAILMMRGLHTIMMTLILRFLYSRMSHGET